MSRDIKYIGMDVPQEAIVIAVRNGSGKLVMESIVETKASSILQFIHGLRGELHVTWEEGTWAAWLYDLLQTQVALRSAAQCLIKGRQQKRQGGCAQAGRLVAHGNAAPGLSRRTWTADAARVGAQLSDPQPRPEPGDEPDQSSVSRLEHPLCRCPGVCSALSGRVATEDRACRRAPACRATLSTVGWIAGVKTNPAPRVIGGEPETQSCETTTSDSLHRSDSGRPLDRADADAAPVPEQTATLDP